MKRPSPILFVVATATLMLGRPTALPAADLDADAVARTLERNNPVRAITRSTHVLDADDLRWIDGPGDHPIGINATVLQSEPLLRQQVRRYVFATAMGNPHPERTGDYFGLLGTLGQDVQPGPTRIDEPDDWSVMGFYSLQLTPTLRLQPSLGFSGAVDDTSSTELSGLIGLEITF